MSKGPFASADTLKDYLGVSIHTVRQWVRDGKIPKSSYMKVGMTYRFHILAVQDALMHYEERRDLTDADREEIAARILERVDSMPDDTPRHLDGEDVKCVEGALEAKYEGQPDSDPDITDAEVDRVFDEDLKDL